MKCKFMFILFEKTRWQDLSSTWTSSYLSKKIHITFQDLTLEKYYIDPS